MVFLGLESDDADGLAEVNKKLNLKRGVDAYDHAFRRIHQAGISVLGAFILGMDNDTPKKLHQRADFMIRSGIDVMQTTYLTPLPGTRLFELYQSEDRLRFTNFPDDWDHYDMTEVIYHPKQMSFAELASISRDIGRRIYAKPILFRKALRTYRETRDFVATMFSWNSNQVYRDVNRASA